MKPPEKSKYYREDSHFAVTLTSEEASMILANSRPHHIAKDQVSISYNALQNLMFDDAVIARFMNCLSLDSYSLDNQKEVSVLNFSKSILEKIRDGKSSEFSENLYKGKER